MRFRRRLAAIAAVGSTAALLLVGGSAVASAYTVHPATKTGREVASHSGAISYATATKKNQEIPVQLRGVVNTTGKAQLGGYSKTHSFFTKVGRLTLKSNILRIQAKVLNSSTCYLQETVKDISPTVIGRQSTGVFAGATGVGQAVVTFRFHFPKNSHGKCNYNGVPRHNGTIKFVCVFPAMKLQR